MRIAFLIPGLKGGGAERFTVNITNTLCENPNNEIYLITGERKTGEYKTKKKIHRVILLSGSLIRDLCRVRHYLKVNSIDVCVGIDIYANLILSINNINLMTTTVLSERTAPNHMPYSRLVKFLRKIFFCRADYYVFQTNDARSFYSRSIQQRSIVIPNPVKEGLPKRIEPIKKEVVAVGRLDKVKNYELLLRAFKDIHKRYPDYKLRIFGDGNQKKHLVELSKNLAIDKNVVFEGFSSNVHNQIAHSDIFVMTSDLEGMPNSLIEAMTMGFPVISTDCPVGAPREMIGENENGLLIPIGDKCSLVRSINQLISDRELNRTLGKKAEKKSREYSIDIIKSKWEDVLSKMISKEYKGMTRL